MELKLINLGLSHRFSKNLKKKFSMETSAGTSYYKAPEVLKGPYDLKCDVCSLGIIMTLMMTRIYPFTQTNASEVYSAIMNDEINTKSHEFEHISLQGIDLIAKLLTKDLKARTSA